MGFICPKCGAKFGNDKDAFEAHMAEMHPYPSVTLTPHDALYEWLYKPKRKQSPNMSALLEAVKDGRLRVRVEWDGGIVFMVTKTGKIYEIPPEQITGDYDGFD